MRYQAILFDLDGTLLDTLPDIFDSINIFLESHQQPALSWQDMQRYISLGSAGLIPYAWREPIHENHLQQYRKEFLELHQRRGLIKTQPFPGVMQILGYLKQHNMAWAVVTNKTASLAQQACQHFAELCDYHCLVGATEPGNPSDKNMPLKPHPAPLLKACQLLNVDPTKCLMVGDTTHDAEAAHAIDMDCVIVDYGYHHPDKPPRLWHSHVIQHIDELQAILKNSTVNQ